MKKLSRKGWIIKCGDAWRQIIYLKVHCEYCKEKFEKYNAHHLIKRSHLATRFDINNGCNLCISCHFKVEQNSPDAYELMNIMIRERGKDWYQALIAKKDTTVKWYEKELSEIYEKLLKEFNKLNK